MRDKRTPKDVFGEARDTRETRVSLARAPFFPAPITSWPVNRRCFIFLFVLFKNIGKLARKKNKQHFLHFRLFSSSPTTTTLRWRSINPLRFIFYHQRPMDFETLKKK